MDIQPMFPLKSHILAQIEHKKLRNATLKRCQSNQTVQTATLTWRTCLEWPADGKKRMHSMRRRYPSDPTTHNCITFMESFWRSLENER